MLFDVPSALIPNLSRKCLFYLAEIVLERKKLSPRLKSVKETVQITSESAKSEMFALIKNAHQH